MSAREQLGRRPVVVRVLVRVVIVVALAGFALIGMARPAEADICAGAPDPLKPKSGLPGMLTTAPKHIPEKAPDPFKDTSVPIGSVYGYNWHWENYDLGCGSDFLRDPVAVTNTQTANVILSHVGATVAGLASLEQMSKTSSMDWLTSVTRGIAYELRGPILSVWLPLGLVGAGLIVAVRARRSGYSETMKTLLIVVVGVGLAVFGLVFPAKASKAVDNAVVSVSKMTGEQFSASPSDSVNRESAYRTWLTGNFGDPDTEVAQELGPRLMWATHYSWSEMQRMWGDPDVKGEIDKRKKAEFKAVAKELEDRDPAAYGVFTGRGERTGPAMFGVVVVLAMGLFVALAMIMVLLARVMAQALAIATPIAVIIGVLPTHTAVLLKLWDLFTAALLAVAKFVIAGGIMALVLGSIQTNDSLGAGAKLFWVVIATVVGLVLTSPLRTFKTIVPGMDPNRSYLRTAINGIAGYFGARLGSEAAKPEPEAAAGASPSRDGGRSTGDVMRPAITAQESLKALPAPVPRASTASEVTVVQVPTASTPLPSRQALEPQRSWPGVVPARTAPLPLTTGRSETGAATATASVSSGQSAVARPEGSRIEGTRQSMALEPGPVSQADLSAAPESGSTPETGGATESSYVAGPAAPRLVLGVAPVVQQVQPTVEADSTGKAETTPSAAADVMGQSSSDEQGGERLQSTSPSDSETELVYPTGVIVADEEPPLYRSSQTEPAGGETYVPLADLELAEDGSEHAMVTYHSQRGGGHESA